MTLASVDVRVYPLADALLPYPSGHLTYALVLDWVRSADPSLAKRCHDDAKFKPFTVSSLTSRVRPEEEQVHIPKYTECRFRFTTLDQRLYDVLSSVVCGLLAKKARLEIAGHTFQLLDVFQEPDSDQEGAPEPGRRSLGRLTSFSELVCLAAPVRTVTLRFHSPTAFRQNLRNLPIPLPLQVFGGLRRKWESYSPVPLPAPLPDEVLDDIVISQLRLSSKLWVYPKHKSVGAVGRCTYELLGKHDEQTLRALSVLADFAFFAGVGYRTTMGMGQCSRIEPNTEGGEQ